MSGTHFYLALPSNASLDVFPNNKTSDYHVQVPQSIELDGNWEVGLYSISYPNTWYTLRNSNVDTHFYFVDNGGWPLVATIKYGHYKTMEEFINSFSTTPFRIKLRHNLSNINISPSIYPPFTPLFTPRVFTPLTHHCNPHKMTFRTGGQVPSKH
jgi:hypothetical protein